MGLEKGEEKMKSLTELRFWLIGYGLSIKDTDKIIKEIENKKQ